MNSVLTRVVEKIDDTLLIVPEGLKTMGWIVQRKTTVETVSSKLALICDTSL
jgi:hypothetical protein